MYDDHPEYVKKRRMEKKGIKSSGDGGGGGLMSVEGCVCVCGNDLIR